MKDGGPVFPVGRRETENGALISDWSNGMSLRDYFAAAALQGLLASMAHPESHGSNLDCYPQSATQAYAIAGAMLAEREKS